VKNHELLIDAFARLASNDPHVWLVCVGQGTTERRAVLAQRVEQSGIASRVVFAGPRDDLANVYAAFDVLALSSICEGFPNVVAEAMACGVPAVVSDTGAAGEIVGEIGLVVSEPGVTAFADGLQALLQRTSSTLSDACRKRIAELYTIDRSADRTLGAFESLFKTAPNS
jgi:glycosyltransferase involved in cell wall biosynthesis